MKKLGAAILFFLGLVSAAPAQQTTQGYNIGCAYNSGLPSINSGFFGYVQCDSHGQLLVSGGGGGGGGLSVLDNSSWTNNASNFTPGGGVFNDSATVLSSGNQGTFRMNAHRAQIFDTDTTNNNLYAAITAAVPCLNATAFNTNSYMNAQTNPANCDLHGNLYVNGSGVTQPVSAVSLPLPSGAATAANQTQDPCQINTATIKSFSITTNTTTNIVTGTSAKKLYVCYLYMQTAAANNVAVISGTTGATCGANTAGLVGGMTATNGLNNAANGGQAMGNGGFSVLQVQTANDDICIITSAATPLAGVIKYVVQ